MSKEVLKKDQLPANVDIFEEDSGIGLEEIHADDMIIPRLGLLQGLSPQCNENKAEYIEGSKPGMFFNTVTNDLYSGKEGMIVVPIHFRATVIEWGLRENGGGFIADHGYKLELLENAKADDKGRKISDAGNQLTLTHEWLVYIVTTEGMFTPAIMSFASTQLKKSRKWSSQLKQLQLQGKNGPFTPPAFYSAYLLKSVAESNDKGDWYGYSLIKNGATTDLPNGMDIYKSAKAFLESFTKGEVKAAAHTAQTDSVESEDDPM